MDVEAVGAEAVGAEAVVAESSDDASEGGWSAGEASVVGTTAEGAGAATGAGTELLADIVADRLLWVWASTGAAPNRNSAARPPIHAPFIVSPPWRGCPSCASRAIMLANARFDQTARLAFQGA
ncbi:MAG: hypothetical protein M3T55_08395 [Pseudomonadota bacterium]|nr:hypothetical protein [Pseudomonadota bacterium]